MVINSSLLISSNYIDLKCQAEILAVELVMNDGSKVQSCLIFMRTIARKRLLLFY